MWWRQLRPNSNGLTNRGAIARRLVMPDPALRWRLFHLAVLGELLLSLQRRDARIVSRRPLSSGRSWTSLPRRRSLRRRVGLWFEAAGVWSHYRRESPYIAATSGLGGEPRPIGADILLLRPDSRALILEVKYPYGPHTADRRARAGVTQAMAYAVEVHSRLALDVTTAVIVPDRSAETPDEHRHRRGDDRNRRTVGNWWPARRGRLWLTRRRGGSCPRRPQCQTLRRWTGSVPPGKGHRKPTSAEIHTVDHRLLVHGTPGHHNKTDPLDELIFIILSAQLRNTRMWVPSRHCGKVSRAGAA